MSRDDIPKTQNAWLVVRRGTPSKAVVLKKDVAVPSKLDKGEVLVKVWDLCLLLHMTLKFSMQVHAAALNPVCVGAFYLTVPL